MDDKKTHIMTGDVLLQNLESAKSAKDIVDLGDLSAFFSDGVPKIAHEEPIKERSRGVKSVNPANMNSLSSADIKDHN